jgi:MFS superfamily sulfate permease-like transporter
VHVSVRGASKCSATENANSGEYARDVLRKVGKTIRVEKVDSPEGELRYRVAGQLFFASADFFAASFEHHGHPRRVEIDLTDARSLRSL